MPTQSTPPTTINAGEPASSPCRQWGVWFRSIGWAVLVMATAECLRVFTGSNCYVVVADKCCRSAQPTEQFLVNAQRAYGIRSVFNLRDENEDQAWYRRERDTCARLDITLVNAGLASKEQPPAHDFKRLILSMRDCPEPVLIHCANGNDRTSLASAFYLLLRTPASLPEARQQLSLRYGHMYWTKAGCLGRILDSYEEWLQELAKEHRPDRLVYWAEHVYQPEYVTAVLPRRKPVRDNSP
ncbi:MAG: tyrosine-protein phosphatase [Planctomycetes bacterium]|nr:tyrosine-protein phosphatase [Planctomycetota bacterium]